MNYQVCHKLAGPRLEIQRQDRWKSELDEDEVDGLKSELDEGEVDELKSELGVD